MHRKTITQYIWLGALCLIATASMQADKDTWIDNRLSQPIDVYKSFQSCIADHTNHLTIAPGKKEKLKSSRKGCLTERTWIKLGSREIFSSKDRGLRSVVVTDNLIISEVPVPLDSERWRIRRHDWDGKDIPTRRGRRPDGFPTGDSGKPQL